MSVNIKSLKDNKLRQAIDYQSMLLVAALLPWSLGVCYKWEST